MKQVAPKARRILLLELIGAFIVSFLMQVPAKATAQVTLVNHSLLEVEIQKTDWSKVETLGAIQDTKTLLSAITSAFPELRIIVIRRPGRIPESLDLWQWQDFRVSRFINLSYERRKFLSYHDEEVLGTYAPAGYESKKFPNRPLLDRPVLVVAADTDRTTIFHELFHYLLDRARFAKGVMGRFQPDSRGRKFADQVSGAQEQFDSALRTLFRTNYDDPKAANDAIEAIRFVFHGNRIRHGEEIAVTQLTYQHRKVLGLNLSSVASEVSYSSSSLKSLLAVVNSMSSVFVEIGERIGMEKFKSFPASQLLLGDLLEVTSIAQSKSSEILSAQLQVIDERKALERFQHAVNSCGSLFR